MAPKICYHFESVNPSTGSEVVITRWYEVESTEIEGNANTNYQVRSDNLFPHRVWSEGKVESKNNSNKNALRFRRSFQIIHRVFFIYLSQFDLNNDSIKPEDLAIKSIIISQCLFE